MNYYKDNITILKGNIVYTKTKEEFIIAKNSYLVAVGNCIKGIFEKLPEEFKEVPVRDYKDNLIVPGLVDLHTHASQFNIRGIGYDKELLPWLESYTFKEEAKFKDKTYGRKVYKEFVNELYRQGTTRAVIFATIHEDTTQILMNLLNKKGICAYVGKVNMDRNSPEYLIEQTDESIKKTEEWIEKCKDKYDTVKVIITPRFVPSCTTSLMNKLGQLAGKYRIAVQSHLSENVSEIQWVKELYPESKSYAHVYDDFGLLGQTKTIMAHGVHLNADEIERIKNNNVFIAHCPSSNVNLSSGIAEISQLLKKGAKVGLGSDIAAGEKLSIFNSMACAIKVSKLRAACLKDKSKPLTISQAFYLGTKGGGEFFGKVGSFEEGYEFDALVIDDHKLWKFEKGSIEERIERLIYLGDERNIIARYAFGKEI